MVKSIVIERLFRGPHGQLDLDNLTCITVDYISPA